MKKAVFILMLACIAAPLVRVYSQNSKENPSKVSVFPGVLKAAEWASFDYNGTIEKALGGDPFAVQKFVEFHSLVDGADGINHGVTCLEMIPLVGDYIFANGCAYANPKFRKILLDRLALAQGRTQKEELRQSLATLAPATWSVLNGNGLPLNPEGEQVKPIEEEKPMGLKLIAPDQPKGKN